MPIYEYECQKCKRVTEHMQSISEKPKSECEHCGGPLEKLISPSAFHLKGGGWYKDLYASQKPGSSADAESGSQNRSTTGAGDAKAKETKPASKASASE